MCRLPIEMSSVQALMDLSLPRFAGLSDGPRQFHPPWSIASDSPASPAPAQLETSGDEAWRCSVDQMSVSSACRNLDLFSSSSEDDSKDPANRSDLSITLFCDSSEADTRVDSDQVLSDGDFPEESVPKDKRHVVRGCASPPGGPSREAAQDDRQYDAPLPIVDLVTGRCKPGKVSRTVSSTPLTLDLTVVCTTSAVVLPPGVSSDTVVPPAIVANEVIDVDASVSVVGTPAPVVEQPSSPVKEGIHVVKLLQPLLPGDGAGAPPRSLILLGKHATDVSTCPGKLRGSPSDDSVLGDPITYARCEHFPGSESPLSLWPYESACLLDPTVLQTVLTSGQDCRVVRTDSPAPEACHFRMGT